MLWWSYWRDGERARFVDSWGVTGFCLFPFFFVFTSIVDSTVVCLKVKDIYDSVTQDQEKIKHFLAGIL